MTILRMVTSSKSVGIVPYGARLKCCRIVNVELRARAIGEKRKNPPKRGFRITGADSVLVRTCENEESFPFIYVLFASRKRVQFAEAPANMFDDDPGNVSCQPPLTAGHLNLAEVHSYYRAPIRLTIWHFAIYFRPTKSHPTYRPSKLRYKTVQEQRSYRRPQYH